MSSLAQLAPDRERRRSSPQGAVEDHENIAVLIPDFATLSSSGSAEATSDCSSETADGNDENDDWDDSTGLDDLEELGWRIDAREIINHSTDQDRSSSPSLSASTVSGCDANSASIANRNPTESAAKISRSASAAPSTNASNQSLTAGARISGPGYPLRWTDEENLGVMRLGGNSTRRAWNTIAYVFNQRFPDNPPRTTLSLYTTQRLLRLRNATMASIQEKIDARGS